MDNQLPAAALTASLLVAKGAGSAATLFPRTFDIAGTNHSPSDAAPVLPFAAGMSNPPLTRLAERANGPARSGVPRMRSRVSLRLDRERHLRLKLAAAHLHLSVQAILTAALDGYLETVADQLPMGSCACLAQGGGKDHEASDAPERTAGPMLYAG